MAKIPSFCMPMTERELKYLIECVEYEHQLSESKYGAGMLIKLRSAAFHAHRIEERQKAEEEQ